MKRKIIAALMAAILLSGCDIKIGRYPRAEQLPGIEAIPPTTLTLTLPEAADEILAATTVLLEAKLSELSDGNITLDKMASEDMLKAYQDGKSGLYLMSSGQMERLDNRLQFTQMPFLFDSGKLLLAGLNSDKGAVRSSAVTAQRLQGEIIGVYYGGTTWFMGRGTFYDDVGFYNSVGVLSEMAGNSCFGAIGGEQVVEGTGAEIMSAFAEEKVKFCEIRPDTEITAEALAAAKFIEPTNHRFSGWWLVLKDPDNSINSKVAKSIREAFAYTVEQQNSQRYSLEERQLASISEKYNITVNDVSAYDKTRLQAHKYYRDNIQTVGIPEDIWKEISSFIH